MKPLYLLPRPQKVKLTGEVLKLPSSAFAQFSGECRHSHHRIASAIERFSRDCGLQYSLTDDSSKNCILKINTSVAKIPPQGYLLFVSKSEIHIESNDEAGAFYALQTLSQIVKQSAGDLPTLIIEDAPLLQTRGFMLDISRCKVPKLESILSFVDLLASLKYNQFQLYIEHTFAFPGHEDVWAESSPLTGNAVQIIDDYCRERMIALVPNFNSFGHFERWLKHPRYTHLAECPQGFCLPALGKNLKHGTTLKPNSESLDFLRSLYDNFLPHFTSNLFNVGGDEPWELGMGATRADVEQRGKHRVYLEFLNRILNEISQRNRIPLFWADIVLERPEMVAEILPMARPVIWGYDDNHPFETQTAVVAKSGLRFYVAPGTSVWNTFHGRFDNMMANIANAAQHATANGADGMILTSWGDNGNHQPLPILYPGLLLGAAHAWRNDTNQWTEEQLITALSVLIFEDASKNIARAIARIGKTDNYFQPLSKNRSTLHVLFFETTENIPKHHNTISVESLAKASENFAQARREIAHAQAHCHDAQLIVDELNLAIDMSLSAITRGYTMLDGTLPNQEWHINRQALRHRFEALWLIRNAPGGLPESANAITL